MYIVNDMPAQVDPALVERLRTVETGTVGHMRHHGFMNPKMQTAFPGVRTAGTAVTVLAPVLDSSVLHYAMGLLRPGDFLSSTGAVIAATLAGAAFSPRRRR